MAYQTGTATGTHDLLDKLRIFAQSIGWTIDRFTTGIRVGYDTKGTWLQLHHADAGYHNLAADNRIGDLEKIEYPSPIIYGFSATGANLKSNNFKDQPNSSWVVENSQYDSYLSGIAGVCSTNALRGPYKAYHFFGSTKYLHVCIEIVAGEYAHFGVGQLEKNSQYTGGEYGYGTVWRYQFQVPYFVQDAHTASHAWLFGAKDSSTKNCSGYTRMDHPDYPDEVQWGKSSYQKDEDVNSVTAASASYCHNPFSALWDATPNTINGIAPLIPISITFQLRDRYCYLIGQVEDVRFINIDNIAPNNIITLGEDRWLVFPIKAKGVEEYGPTGIPNSWHYGVAYRVID